MTRSAVVLFLVVGLVFAGSIAWAQDPAPPKVGSFTLKFGETVSVSVRELGGNLLVGPPEPGGKEAKGVLVFALIRDGDLRILSCRNRTDKTILYDCWLNFKDHSAPTSIVPVFPLGAPANEIWQDNFLSLTVGNIRLDPSEESQKFAESLTSGKPAAGDAAAGALAPPPQPASEKAGAAQGPAAPAPPAAPTDPVPAAAPQAALTSQQSAEMAASLQRARLLYEMEAVRRAGSEALAPAIQRAGSSIPSDAHDLESVIWKDGEVWRMASFYKAASGECYPIAAATIPPPVYPGCKVEVSHADLNARKPLEDPARVLALSLLAAKATVQEREGKNAALLSRMHAVRETGGEVTCYLLPADGSPGVYRPSPSGHIRVGAQAMKVLETRITHAEAPVFREGLQPGEMSLPQKPEWKLTTTLPQAEDLLFLMLHPALSPLVAASPAGGFLLKAGLLPEFLPPGSPRVSTSPDAGAGSGSWSVPVVKSDKKDMPLKKDELLEMTRSRAAFLFFFSWHAREARKLMAGSTDCPAFPETPDLVLDVPQEGPFKDQAVIYFVKAGEQAPCAAVVAKQQVRGWHYERAVSVPPVPAAFQDQLGIIRAARKEVEGLLGPGCHYFAVQPGPEPNSGMVFAWSEIERQIEPGYPEDTFLIGSYATVMMLGGSGQYHSVGDFVLEPATRGWKVREVHKEAPLGIQSAADPKEAFFGEFEILRCRLSPWLCPRLIASDGTFYLVQGDGSYRELTKGEAKKVASLDPAYYPKVIYENKPLAEFMADPKVVNRPEK